MLRVVLDANQFVSALLKTGSNPDLIMRMVREDRGTLIMSEDIRSEILRVLTYPKIAKRLACSPEELASFIDRLGAVAVMTPGAIMVEVIADDPSDNKYLDCAMEAKADFIVSGDHHLLDLHVFKGIRIITPASFLEICRLSSSGIGESDNGFVSERHEEFLGKRLSPG
jgi:uncharacterized protein